MDKKPWFSKTIVVSTVLGLLTLAVPFIPSAAPLAAWLNANGVLVGTAWAVLTIALRTITKGAITLVD